MWEKNRLSPNVTKVRSKVMLVLPNVRASPADSSNFCTVWRMNSDFYLYLSTFSNTPSNRFSISFKYYFFNSLFILFLTTTHLPTFFYTTHHYYNRKNVFEEWIVAHQTWWATVEEWIVTFTFIYQLFQIHLSTDSLSHLNIIFFIYYLFFF